MIAQHFQPIYLLLLLVSVITLVWTQQKRKPENWSSWWTIWCSRIFLTILLPMMLLFVIYWDVDKKMNPYVLTEKNIIIYRTFTLLQTYTFCCCMSHFEKTSQQHTYLHSNGSRMSSWCFQKEKNRNNNFVGNSQFLQALVDKESICSQSLKMISLQGPARYQILIKTLSCLQEQ